MKTTKYKRNDRRKHAIDRMEASLVDLDLLLSISPYRFEKFEGPSRVARLNEEIKTLQIKLRKD